jgi:RimJ/RimL family protein N-acetyltransferase
MNLLTPVTLTGNAATLVPLAPEHCADLITAIQDGELWKIWYLKVPTPETMASEIHRRLDLQQQGTLLPFTVICNATHKPVGMTTYYQVDLANRRCDIGSWYRKSCHKTAINTECKLMLLCHAFETLNCIAVTFNTNAYNMESRRAIERLGAKLDGILRNHSIMPNGIICDFYHYSIIHSEWPAVKANLLHKLSLHQVAVTTGQISDNEAK